MPLRCAVAFVFLVACSSGPSVPAQEKRGRPSPDPSDSVDYYFTHVAPKKKLIETELEKNGPHEPWEGCFANQGINGPKRGWMISRKVGYVSISRLVDMGTVEVQGTRIALKSVSGKTWGPDWPVYEIVRWGERVYLVPPDNFLDFCNDANDGSLLPGRLFTPYLSKCGDDEKKVSGLPDVPDEYKGYLLDKPVTGRVTAVGGEKEDVAVWGKQRLISGTSVTLDVGKAQKIRTGMRFYPERKDDRGRRGYVISVTATQCELLFETVVDTGQQQPVKSGSRWTTSDPYYATQ